MDEPESTKTVNVRAQDSSVISGRHAIVQSLQQKAQIPQVSVTRDSHSTEESFSNTTVNIEAHECDVSVADDTAVLVNIKPPEETEEPDSEPLPRGDSSTHVTGGTVEGSKNLHFLVREHGKYIQIGQCCLIVEINADDQMLEQLRARGTLEVKIGTSLVTITWRDIETDEEEMKARIKIQLKTSLTEKLQTLEKTVIRDLVDNNFDKCQQLVAFLFTKLEGHLTDISTGCLQLTVVFLDYEKLNRGTSSEAMSEIQKFLNSLLLTEELKKFTKDVGFSVTLLDQEVYQNTATIDSREQTKTITDGKQSGIPSLGADASSQLSRQISEQVQQSVIEEFARFRLELPKILRNTVNEVLPEIEERIYEKYISAQRELKEPVMSPSPSSESQKESTESEKISKLVGFVQSKVTGSKPGAAKATQLKDEGKQSYLSDVKVTPWKKPLDFSHLFNAIQGNRSKQDVKGEELTSPETSEHHEKLTRIFGHDELRGVQGSLQMAEKAMKNVNDDFVISEEFCTVLCLDSFHMTVESRSKGEAIIKGCAGYVCLISVGDELNVEQELTKDKDLALKALRQLTESKAFTSGQYRYTEGLILALKLLHGRVTPTDYGPYYTLYPKIVFVSGVQESSSTMETLMSVLRAMSIEIPVYIAPIQSGVLSYFTENVIRNVEFLADSKVTEITKGKVLNAIISHGKAVTPYRSWQRIRKELLRDHSDKEVEKITWFVTEHFSRPPPIGTRIMSFRTYPPGYGTILGFSEQATYGGMVSDVLVVEDSGINYVHPWEFTQEGLRFYKHSRSADLSDFPVGTIVRKGPADRPQFGAPLGVVIQNVNSDNVKVCWRLNEAPTRYSYWTCKTDICKTSEIRIAESPLIDLESLIPGEEELPLTYPEPLTPKPMELPLTYLGQLASTPRIVPDFEGDPQIAGGKYKLKQKKEREDKLKRQHTPKLYAKKEEAFKVEEKDTEEWRKLHFMKPYSTFKMKERKEDRGEKEGQEGQYGYGNDFPL